MLDGVGRWRRVPYGVFYIFAITFAVLHSMCKHTIQHQGITPSDVLNIQLQEKHTYVYVRTYVLYLCVNCLVHVCVRSFCVS